MVLTIDRIGYKIREKVIEKQIYKYMNMTQYILQEQDQVCRLDLMQLRPTSGYASLMSSLPVVPLRAQFLRQVPVLKHYHFPNNSETKETCFPDLDLPMTKTCDL